MKTLFFFILSWMSLISLRANAALPFQANSVHVIAIAGTKLNVDLRNWLAPSTQAPLGWAIRGNFPQWLFLSSEQASLSGQAPENDANSYDFQVYAQTRTGDWQMEPVQLSLAPASSVTEGVLDLGTETENEYFEINLSTLASSQENFRCTVRSKLPNWMTLKPTGVLSGIPKRKNAGTYTVELFISNGPQVTNKFATLFAVQKRLNWPKWISNSLVVQDARVNQTIRVDLGNALVRGEEKQLGIRLVSTPPWIQLNKDGILVGTPGPENLGPVEVKAVWTAQIEGEQKQGETTLRFQVGW